MDTVRVRRGGDGKVIGYWFPDDFDSYISHVRANRPDLIQRLRETPNGQKLAIEFYRDICEMFESFSRSQGRLYTADDVTSSVAELMIEAVKGRQ